MNKIFKNYLQNSLKRAVEEWQTLESALTKGTIKAEGVNLKKKFCTEFVNNFFNGNFTEIKNAKIKKLDLKTQWSNLIPIGISFNVGEVEMDIRWLRTESKINFKKIKNQCKPSKRRKSLDYKVEGIGSGKISRKNSRKLSIDIEDDGKKSPGKSIKLESRVKKENERKGFLKKIRKNLVENIEGKINSIKIFIDFSHLGYYEVVIKGMSIKTYRAKTEEIIQERKVVKGTLVKVVKIDLIEVKERGSVSGITLRKLVVYFIGQNKIILVENLDAKLQKRNMGVLGLVYTPFRFFKYLKRESTGIQIFFSDNYQEKIQLENRVILDKMTVNFFEESPYPYLFNLDYRIVMKDIEIRNQQQNFEKIMVVGFRELELSFIKNAEQNERESLLQIFPYKKIFKGKSKTNENNKTEEINLDKKILAKITTFSSQEFITQGTQENNNFIIEIFNAKALIKKKINLLKQFQKHLNFLLKIFFRKVEITKNEDNKISRRLNQKEISFTNCTFQLGFYNFRDLSFEVLGLKIALKALRDRDYNELSLNIDLDVKEIIGYNKQNREYEFLLFGLKFNSLNITQISTKIQSLVLNLTPDTLDSIRLLYKDLLTMAKFPKFISPSDLNTRQPLVEKENFDKRFGCMPFLQNMKEFKKLRGNLAGAKNTQNRFKLLNDLYKFDIEIQQISLGLNYHTKLSKKLLNMFFFKIQDLKLKTAGALSFHTTGYQNYDFNNPNRELLNLKIDGNFYYDKINLTATKAEFNPEYIDLYLLEKYLNTNLESDLYKLGFITKVFNLLESDMYTDDDQLVFKKMSRMDFPSSLLVQKSLNYGARIDFKKLYCMVIKDDYIEQEIDRNTVLVLRRNNHSLKMYFIASKSVQNITDLDLVLYDKINPNFGLVVPSVKRVNEKRLLKLSDAIPQKFSEPEYIRDALMGLMDNIDPKDVKETTNQEFDSIGYLNNFVDKPVGVEKGETGEIEKIDFEGKNMDISKFEVVKEMVIRPKQGGFKIVIKIFKNQIQKFTYLELRTKNLRIHTIYSQLFVSLHPQNCKEMRSAYPIYGGNKEFFFEEENEIFKFGNNDLIKKVDLMHRKVKPCFYKVQVYTNRARESEKGEDGKEKLVEKIYLRDFVQHNMTMQIVRFYAPIRIQNNLDRNLLFLDSSQKIFRIHQNAYHDLEAESGYLTHLNFGLKPDFIQKNFFSEKIEILNMDSYDNLMTIVSPKVAHDLHIPLLVKFERNKQGQLLIKIDYFMRIISPLDFKIWYFWPAEQQQSVKLLTMANFGVLHIPSKLVIDKAEFHFSVKNIKDEIVNLVKEIIILYPNSYQSLDLKKGAKFKICSLSKISNSSVLTEDKLLKFSIEMNDDQTTMLTAFSPNIQSIGYIMTIPSRKYTFLLTPSLFAKVRNAKDIKKVSSNITKFVLPVKVLRSKIINLQINKLNLRVFNRESMLIRLFIDNLRLEMSQCYQLLRLEASLKLLQVTEEKGNKADIDKNGNNESVVLSIHDGNISLINETIARNSFYNIPFVILKTNLLLAKIKSLKKFQFLLSRHLVNLLFAVIFPKLKKCDQKSQNKAKLIKNNSTFTHVEFASISNFNLGLDNNSNKKMMKMSQGSFKNINKIRSKILSSALLSFLKSKATTFILEENIFKIVSDAIHFVASNNKKIEEDYLNVSKMTQNIGSISYENSNLIFQKKMLDCSLSLYVDKIVIVNGDGGMVVVSKLNEVKVFKVKDGVVKFGFCLDGGNTIISHVEFGLEEKGIVLQLVTELF